MVAVRLLGAPSFPRVVVVLWPNPVPYRVQATQWTTAGWTHGKAWQS